MPFQLKIRRTEAGFSLIEVLIAMTVIGVGFLAVASMQGVSITSNHNSSLMTQATYLAEERIEELRNRSYININATGSPEANIDAQGQPGTGGLFTRTWTVAFDSPGVLMKTITVTVTWRERGLLHNVTMTTIICS